MDRLSYDSFEKSLSSLPWWSSDGRELDLSVAGDKVSVDLKFYLAYAVHVVAGAEIFIGQVRRELLAEIRQSTAFEVANFAAAHESAKALLFEALSSGDKIKIAAMKKCAEKLAEAMASLLVMSDLSALKGPGNVAFYQSRLSVLAGLLASQGDQLCSDIVLAALGIG